MMFHKIKRIEMGMHDTAVYFLTNGNHVVNIKGEYTMICNDEAVKIPKLHLEPCFDTMTGFMVGFVEV